MIKLQDFARECGVTDRQIHRLLNKYEDAIAGHFERQGQNGTWLDETACQILQSKMKKLPPSVSDQQTVREKAALEKENKRLNELLGAQGIIIGQMHQEISELQQFKLDTLKEQKALEASKEAQDRRQQELLQREATMDEEVRTAVQEAVEAQKAALDELRAQEVAKVREEAKKVVEDAEHLHQQELAARDEKIRELENRSLWQILTASFRKKQE